MNLKKELFGPKDRRILDRRIPLNQRNKYKTMELSRNNKPNLYAESQPKRQESEFNFSCREPCCLPRTKNLLPNSECLCRIQRPRKTPERHVFCNLKLVITQLLRKIIESELDFRVLHGARPGAYTRNFTVPRHKKPWYNSVLLEYHL